MKKPTTDPGMQKIPRPKDYRPPMPPKIKMEVLVRQEGRCGCGCNEKLGSMDNVQFDHDPALVNRDWDEWNGDTIPEANDPAYIFAKTIVHHQTKTKKDIKTRDKDRRVIAATAEHKARMEVKAGRAEPEPVSRATGSGARGHFAPDVIDELDEKPGLGRAETPRPSFGKGGAFTRSGFAKGRKMATNKDNPIVKGVDGKLKPRVSRVRPLPRKNDA
ncbi:hypothetical protein [Hyphomicrobium sp.]|uniref:hypothetical protein n=1 Tax=Hyphomicrobium sp. TaxID=82 RepID=UPI001DA5DD05|nr:hypothetical protein [Hyphomicrobium sp.]MBY0561443.1 hypothetical protein [Hyphomicrobium sp.]